ncbi:MAG: YhdP family protein, partial [Rhodanobacter sp.]
MNARWQRWLHRIARALGWTVGVLVIALAVSAALAQLLLPLLARHPQWVAAQLSERIHRQVSFASMEGRWEPSGPLFVMRDVTIAGGEGGRPLHLPESELKLDFGGWLFPSRHLLNLHVRGLQLDLSRDADGAWHINGIGMAGGQDRQKPAFGQLSLELWLDDLQLDITDESAGRHYTVVAQQLRMSRQGSHIRVGAILRRTGATGVLHGAGSFRDDGSSGRLWLAGNDVDLHGLFTGVDMGGYAVDSGHGNVAAWLDWKSGKVVRNLIRFDLTDVAIANPDGGKAEVSALHGIAELRRSEDGYEARWAGDDGSALVGVLHQLDTPQAHAEVAARHLQLAPLVPWLALKPKLSPALAQWVGGGHPRGQLQHAEMRWSQADGLQQLDVGFDGLGIDPVGTLPGIDNLQGELLGDAEAISVELPEQATVLRFPHLFREPFVMPKLGGTLAFWHDEDHSYIGVDSLDFEGQGFGGTTRGEVALPNAGGRPFLDLYATLTHADITAAKLFWPINAMPLSAMAWLDQALVAGELNAADVLVRGDLKDWPFHQNEGRFEAHAEISDLTIHYGKDWPSAEGVHAIASFVNNSMLVEADAGQSLGVKADKAVALIPDLAHTTLDLNVSGSGNGANLLDFVGKSPIGDHHTDVLSKLKLGGSGTFAFHLSLPVGHMPDTILNGTAQLKDMDLDAPDWTLKLDKLNGPATFDLHGFHAGPLDAGFHGEPSKLEMFIAGANADPATVFSARLSGNYSMAELIQGYTQLNWLGDVTSGKSDFTVGFDITTPTGSTTPTQTLSVDSSLTGMALSFPVPLKKAATTTLPLHLTMGLPVAGSDLQVALGSAMRGRFKLPANDQQMLAATLAFGNQMPDTLPTKGLRIRGHADRLDVTGWVQNSIAGSTTNGPSLESIDVSAAHAVVFDHDFPDMRIQATPQADLLSLDVSSAAIAGHFSVPTADLRKRGITARLQRLYWPKETTSPVKKNGVVVAPAINPANTGITPSSLPPLHLSVSDLRLGDAKLGEARLETWPSAKGLHIDQLRALSSHVQINGSGDWDGTSTDSHTRMHIDFAAENLGDMLDALGYDGFFSGGKTHDQLDATWP